MNPLSVLPNGYLPPGVHVATLDEIIERFGTATPRRQVLAGRLRELFSRVLSVKQRCRAFI
jgi:hypothetical protein